MNTAEPEKGLILLRQQGYFHIDESAALDALPDSLKQCPREKFLIDLSAVTEQAVAARDWHEAGRLLLSKYREHIKPLLEANPDFKIAYFGTVPIPLAIQLGYLLGTWRGAEVFQHHHIRKNWKWEAPTSKASKFEVQVTGLPSVGNRAEGDIVVRVSTSHLVDPAFTYEVVDRALAEVSIRTSILNEDILTSPLDVETVADCFKATIDQLHVLFPNASALHLFVSCPVGMALRLGMRISPTIHPPVQTYEFNTKLTPKYYPSILLQSEPTPTIIFTSEEKAAAVIERGIWNEELTRLKELAQKISESGSKSWLSDVLEAKARKAFSGSWNVLPSIRDITGLRNSRIDLEATNAADGFSYLPDQGSWILGDSFLIPVMRRIAEEPQRRIAARLFLLHESLHLHQGLTMATSPQMGRFPKVLEEMDYEADVWAQLYERRMATDLNPERLTDEPAFLRNLISIATETMFSFDAGSLPTAEMQIRRVSRYLIWAWQSLQTERFNPGDDVWSVLAEKPNIELAGPQIRTRDNRIWYVLDPRHTTAPEISVYARGRIHRYGTGPASQHEEIIEALRASNGQRLRAALRGVFDLAVPHST